MVAAAVADGVLAQSVSVEGQFINSATVLCYQIVFTAIQEVVEGEVMVVDMVESDDALGLRLVAVLARAVVAVGVAHDGEVLDLDSDLVRTEFLAMGRDQVVVAVVALQSSPKWVVVEYNHTLHKEANNSLECS